MIAIDNCNYKKERVRTCLQHTDIYCYICDLTSLYIKDERDFKRKCKSHCSDFYKEKMCERFIQRRVNVYRE